ncbi:TetR family transcriptional regulator [Tamaricihabitans halophyticus]|uniref:TetR family transcriptional regulator n=1 Tax=Tamaricihabitans halophyticus TaxID=1262583 RepID=A0A4R2QKY8_9PSEU|nr:TetR/AcrR family transcriptional regulator [Tamaricihabitans halophyticus]TCP50123.1 TetR family transcriptional regulator [Tamaricihabitans halophyticus]
MIEPPALLDRVLASVEPDDPGTRAILDCALTAFTASGVRRSTMGEIAERAGLGVATLYRRFPRKEQLVEAVVLREVRRFIEHVDARIQRVSGMPAQVVEGFVAFAVGVREHPLLGTLLSSEPDTVLPACTVAGGPMLALARTYLTEQIQRLQNTGELPMFDPEPAAEIIARLTHSLMLTPDGRIPIGDDERTRAFARDHIIPLLAGPPASGGSETAR